MSRKDIFDAKDIMNLTDNGRDIFEHELGYIPSKNISSPLRVGDSNPSFQVKRTSAGNWKAVDYRGNFEGNAIEFVQALYGLSFGKAIEKIVADLGLRNIRNNTKYKRIEKKEEIHIEKEPLLIEFSDMSFTKKHHEYFNRGHLSEDFLRNHDIYAAEKWAIEKKIQPILEDEIVFAYYARDIDKTKILRIGENIPAELKWRSGMNNSYLWSFWEHDHIIDDMFVIKSRKDEMIAKFLGYDTISTQNESSKIMMGNVERINSISRNPIICYGTDPQGKEESIKITQATSWKWFNIQNKLYNKYGIDDLFEFSSEFGLELLDKLIQLKGFKKSNI